MFACLFVPDFPVEAIVRTAPELREQGVAVVEGSPPTLTVAAINELARHATVEVGMTELQARGRMPGIEVRHRSAVQEIVAAAALVDVASAISPRVESVAPDTVLLDIAGIDRLFGPPQKIARELAKRVSEVGMEANIAVACNADAAICGARGFSGVTVIPRGKEAERLAPLPVDVLVAGPDEHARDVLETLDRWGVRTFRALGLLPEIALSERLGAEGLRLRKLARGEGERALKAVERPLQFEEAVELEYPIDLLEPLAFVLNRMLEQLCARLGTRALATHELRLRLELEDVPDIDYSRESMNSVQTNGDVRHSPVVERTIKLPVPMLDAKVFLKLLQLDLRSSLPGAPVSKIFLQAEPTQPRFAQGGLFLPTAPEPARLEVTLARIAGVLRQDVQQQIPGSARDNKKRNTRFIPPATPSESHSANQHGQADSLRVGSAEVLARHTPDAFRMKRFSPPALDEVGAKRGATTRTAPEKAIPRRTSGLTALRRFRPPLTARVRLAANRPAHVDAGTAHAGDVVWAAGPWRSSGEWWSEHQWSRETWDVAVQNGTVVLYRLFRDSGNQWFLEGIYD